MFLQEVFLTVPLLLFVHSGQQAYISFCWHAGLRMLLEALVEASLEMLVCLD